MLNFGRFLLDAVAGSCSPLRRRDLHRCNVIRLDLFVLDEGRSVWDDALLLFQILVLVAVDLPHIVDDVIFHFLPRRLDLVTVLALLRHIDVFKLLAHRAELLRMMLGGVVVHIILRHEHRVAVVAEVHVGVGVEHDVIGHFLAGLERQLAERTAHRGLGMILTVLEELVAVQVHLLALLAVV